MSTIAEDESHGDEDQAESTQQTDYAEDKAREAAEARRLRILKKSKDRMGLVEGTLPKEQFNSDETAATDVQDQQLSENADSGTAVAAPKSSAAARMAAARRMRFKKAAAAADASSTVEAATKTDTVDTAISTEGSTESTMATNIVSNADESKRSNEETDTSGQDGGVKEVARSTQIPVEEPVPAATNESKKYEGVAKMRRRMVKERQLKQEEVGEKEDEPAALKKAKERALKVLAKKGSAAGLQSTLPLWMSVVTVLLLFLAGLDVGLHQGQIDYGIQKQLLRVHTELAPREFGIRVQGVFDGFFTSSSTKRTLLQDETDPNVDDTDEFAVPTKNDNVVSNIDPLFGVDLDQFTKGDGLYFAAGRFAVQCHRVNLAIFYYLPLKIFTGIASSIWQLIDSPPLFCLVAIVIRQLIGKTLLGAKIPIAQDDEATKSKDVLSMAKSFASSFITKSFPTAVLLYDAFSHVRSDMYVVLCGFLVGVAYMHSTDGGFLSGWRRQQVGSDDELVDVGGYRSPPQVMVKDHMGTDEL